MQNYNKIQSLREKNNLSQCELAEKMGVHLTTVIRWESGEIAKPSKSKVKKLEKILRAKKKIIWPFLKNLKAATHEGVLPIGDISIRCFVLENGERVLIQKDFIEALDISRTGNRLFKFANQIILRPFISESVINRLKHPLIFKHLNGKIQKCYEATLLADLCQVVINAKNAGALRQDQLKIAKACEVLINVYAKVGIVAIVDEATGYQEERSIRALRELLGVLLQNEKRKWEKTFPDEFYRQMFKLWGWDTSDISRRSGYAGKLTNNLIYERLVPEVLKELEKRNPKFNGRRKHRHHQFLTKDYGCPALANHIEKVITIMRIFDENQHELFMEAIDKTLPKQLSYKDLKSGQKQLPFNNVS